MKNTRDGKVAVYIRHSSYNRVSLMSANMKALVVTQKIPSPEDNSKKNLKDIVTFHFTFDFEKRNFLFGGRKAVNVL